MISDLTLPKMFAITKKLRGSLSLNQYKALAFDMRLIASTNAVDNPCSFECLLDIDYFCQASLKGVSVEQDNSFY